MSEYFDKVTRRIKVYVAPCIKCGGEDIRLYDGGYNTFNYGGGKCQNKQCKNEVSDGVGCDPTHKELAAIWNKKNNPQILLAALDTQIEKLTAEKARITGIVEYRAANKKQED